MSAATTWYGRVHVGSLSAIDRFVPAVMYWRTASVELVMVFSGENSKHFCLKLVLLSLAFAPAQHNRIAATQIVRSLIAMVSNVSKMRMQDIL